MAREYVTYASDDYQEATQPDLKYPSKTAYDYATSKIETPKYLPMVKADQQMVDTLEKFDNDPMVTMFFHSNKETDYWIWGRDEYGKPASVLVCQMVSINGVQYYLYPGKNHVPKTVYEFLTQIEETARRITIQPNSPKCLADYDQPIRR